MSKYSNILSNADTSKFIYYPLTVLITQITINAIIDMESNDFNQPGKNDNGLKIKLIKLYINVRKF